MTASSTAYEYLARGQFYLKQGMLQNGIDHSSAAVDLNQDLAPPHYNRDIAQRNAGDTFLAIADYDRAHTHGRAFANLYFNRGTANGDQGEHRNAIRDFDQALELDPTLTNAYLARGTAYRVLGEEGKAQSDLFRHSQRTQESG